MEKLSDVMSRIQEVTEFLGIELSDVNQRGIFGNTPLKVAVIWQDPEAVRVLLDAGADPNARGEDGFTPLHHAAAMGDAGIAKLLIERGASPSEPNDEGDTPIDIASRLRNHTILEVFRGTESG